MYVFANSYPKKIQSLMARSHVIYSRCDTKNIVNGERSSSSRQSESRSYKTVLDLCLFDHKTVLDPMSFDNKTVLDLMTVDKQNVQTFTLIGQVSLDFLYLIANHLKGMLTICFLRTPLGV